MSKADGQLRLGFLAAIEAQDRALVGGLLVTDRHGRPFEFQCTTPVKPNRTQELLYGPTLVPFILADLLGKALLDRVGVKPSLVFAERYELLRLKPLIQMPVACLEPVPKTSCPSIQIGLHTWYLSPDHAEDVDAIRQLTDSSISEDADLKEPLERVSAALRETMSTVSAKPRVA
jgi:hypothetical protein